MPLPAHIQILETWITCVNKRLKNLNGFYVINCKHKKNKLKLTEMCGTSENA